MLVFLSYNKIASLIFFPCNSLFFLPTFSNSMFQNQTSLGVVILTFLWDENHSTASLSSFSHFSTSLEVYLARCPLLRPICDQAFSLLPWNTALAPFLVPQCHLFCEYHQSLLQKSWSKTSKQLQSKYSSVSFKPFKSKIPHICKEIVFFVSRLFRLQMQQHLPCGSMNNANV